MPQTRRQKRQADVKLDMDTDGQADNEIEALKKEIEHLKLSKPALGNVPLPRQSPYEGTTSFDAFKHQFLGLSKCSRWGEEEKRLRLLSSLKGEAAEYIFQLQDFSELSFDQLVESLERRFGDHRKKSYFLSQLETRRLGRTESIAEYVADIRTLATKGYPAADRETIESICIRHFIRGLGDQQLSITVGMREPASLEEARDIVEMYRSLRDDDATTTSTQVRKVNSCMAESAVTEKRLKEFGEQLSASLTENVITQLSNMPHFRGNRGGFRGRGRGRGRGYGPRSAEHIRCFNCGEMGHYARDCNVHVNQHDGAQYGTSSAPHLSGN